MCGIVGYVGRDAAEKYLIQGLKQLEYRGYDSAGISVLESGTLQTLKSEGRVDILAEKVKHMKIEGTCGIGHTRWATHGAPVFRNAHPHLSEDGCFAVVHNGIIENSEPLKSMLLKKGVIFQSDTDSEVIPQLMQTFFDGDVRNTLRNVLSMLRGTYGLAMISSYAPDVIFAAAKESPLVLGKGEGKGYIASDISALGCEITEGYFLKDGEYAEVTADGICLWNPDCEVIHRKPVLLERKEKAADKGTFRDFMLKEMMEQPETIRNTLCACVNREGDLLSSIPESFFSKVRKVHVIGCGSAYHAGLMGSYMIEKLAKTETKTVLASEFRYAEPLMHKDDITVFISQSGETADTLAAMRYAKMQGIKTLCIVNRQESSLARESKEVIRTYAGEEIAVATTKAYTAQVVASCLLALRLGIQNGAVSKADCKEYAKSLFDFSECVAKVLEHEEKIQALAKMLHEKKTLFFIGRGMDYAAAKECSLKLKEISYIHSEAYAAGELKHGTISLIEEGIPVIAIVTQKNVLDKMKSNIREVRARGAFVIAVATEGLMEKTDADILITVPECVSCLSALLAVIPMQLLSYFVALEKGLDADKPRNLAKSVTVE